MMCTMDSFVDQESIARVIDVSVESLDLDELGFDRVGVSEEGRPSYPPKSLLKLYIYGNRKCIRFSRKLGEACRVNVEVKWLNRHVEEYLRQMDEVDKMDEESEGLSGQFTLEEIEMKLAEARERLERYEGYREYMEKNGLPQLSITDPDAKLMKNKNGFAVSYNVQTAVDSETHLIRDYEITNHPTGHGLLAPTVHGIKEESL